MANAYPCHASRAAGGNVNSVSHVQRLDRHRTGRRIDSRARRKAGEADIRTMIREVGLCQATPGSEGKGLVSCRRVNRQRPGTTEAGRIRQTGDLIAGQVDGVAFPEAGDAIEKVNVQTLVEN
jgi:hypothetical protein